MPLPITVELDELETVERCAGTVLSITLSKNGFVQFVIRADDSALLKRNRLYGHQSFWDGDFPSDLRVGNRVTFLPNAPRKPAQLPRAVMIREEKELNYDHK
jgi:hypothetical protein